MAEEQLEYATLGGGCFWCLEAVFQRLNGVERVTSGYAGGDTAHPTYKEVCTGQSGHAEVVQIAFDPGEVSFDTLLEVFFAAHDPTQWHRQGNDVGSQYRSVVLYHDTRQKEAAEKIINRLAASGAFDSEIVTEIAPLDTFYPAEDYHQDFYQSNPRQPYCQLIIEPKLEKVGQFFPAALQKT